MLSRLLIFVVIINVLPRVHLTSVTFKNGTAGINRSKQIESLKQYILKQLGFPNPPNSSSETIPEDKLTDYHIQNHMLKQREENEHEECDTKGSNAINITTIPGNCKSLDTQGYRFKRGSCSYIAS